MSGAAGSGSKSVGPKLRNVDEAVAALLMADPVLRRKHYAMMRSIVYLTWAHAVMALVAFYIVAHPAKLQTALLRPDGTATLYQTTTVPITSVASLSEWATNAVVRAYSFGFENWKASQIKSKPNFTAAGWDGFQAALESSDLLSNVVSKKLRVTAVPESPAILLNAGSGKLADGREGLRFQMRILVTYEGPLKPASEVLVVQLDVVPQPTFVNPRGWGIAKLIAL